MKFVPNVKNDPVLQKLNCGIQTQHCDLISLHFSLRRKVCHNMKKSSPSAEIKCLPFGLLSVTLVVQHAMQRGMAITLIWKQVAMTHAKLRFGIIMVEMGQTTAHFKQEGSCPGRGTIRVRPERTMTDCDGSPALTGDDRCRIFDSRNLF
jgi:hypothetical protein